MRLWSIHPKYLDRIGLIALWRESLLALAVLKGETKGYKSHPQLIRFKGCKDPIVAILRYLEIVRIEAIRRGYNFKELKKVNSKVKINVSEEQIKYEFSHILKKLKKRDLKKYKEVNILEWIECHPLFEIVPGPIESWEKPILK